jgi:hypothetical protein
MTNQDISKLINKEVGKTAIICGTGPSLGNYLNILESNNDYIKICCNEINIMTKIVPNYWVFANSHQTIHSMVETFKKFPNTTVVHADSVDTTPWEWIVENVDTNYFRYDQRHFNGETCTNCPNKCHNLNPKFLTIQELLKNYTNYEKIYSTGSTVAVHMLALAILLGCKKIYICGVELNYSLGYVSPDFTNYSSFNPHLDEILTDFEIIKQSAEKINVEIQNLSDMSHLKKIFNTSNIL